MTLKRIILAVLIVVAAVLIAMGVVKLLDKPSALPQGSEAVPEINVNEIISQTVQKSLVDGEEIYVNSGLSWDINVSESRLKEAESISKEFLGDY
ncbi:MAG: hypothetical protein IJE46_04590 [Clostridia bacterium]|nr:hypothetical protein [Clostridia bacterium]